MNSPKLTQAVWCVAIAVALDFAVAAAIMSTSWSYSKLTHGYQKAATPLERTTNHEWRAAQFAVATGIRFDGWIDPDYVDASVNLMPDLSQAGLPPLPQSLPPMCIGRIKFGFPLTSHSVPVTGYCIGGGDLQWSNGGQIELLEFSVNVTLAAFAIFGLGILVRWNMVRIASHEGKCAAVVR